MIEFKAELHRLTETDSPQDIVNKLSDRLPFAGRIVQSILNASATDIDYIKYLLVLDHYEIYGYNLSRFFDMCCKRDLEYFYKVVDSMVEHSVSPLTVKAQISRGEIINV